MLQKNDIRARKGLFWIQHKRFLKHPLETEMPSPDTHNLSQLSQNNLDEAIKMLQRADIKALTKMSDYIPQLEELEDEIDGVLGNNNRIFIAGCGASGRLAVLLETLWRREASSEKKNSVVGFIAGGDSAIIKSIEGFEDYSEYGIKQLKEAGFKDGDLLISTSASGESPFATGAIEYAVKKSLKPWFLHCNPQRDLEGRCPDHIIHDKNVNSIGLYTGQMALTGSTRMQATTALMVAIGVCLLEKGPIKESIENFIVLFSEINMSPLSNFIVDESECYRKLEYVTYDTSPHYGLSVLTDTTERAPTFNLSPFENQLDTDITPSWCYILFSNAEESKEAWKLLLNRPPRTLNWKCSTDTHPDRLYGFDFSKNLVEYRSKYTGKSHIFKVHRKDGKLELEFKKNTFSIDISTFSHLFEQLLIKLILNTSSTLVMGRLGYYKGNLMTSLYPSNSKLIDRAIRYIDYLFTAETGRKLSYDMIARKMFKELEMLKANESVVFKTVDKLLSHSCTEQEV